MQYLSTALGLKAEEDPNLDGDWLQGPKKVFQMEPGFSHMYQGFISPNNICGKMKFFIPNGVKTNRSKQQQIGEKGITLHSFYTAKLDMVYGLVQQHDLNFTEILKNEFGERSFVIRDTAGVSWQIIEKTDAPKNTPQVQFNFKMQE